MTEYVITDANYDELDRFQEEPETLDAHSTLMASHPHGVDVKIQRVEDGEDPFDPSDYDSLEEAIGAASFGEQEDIAIAHFQQQEDESAFAPADYDDVDAAMEAASDRHEQHAAIVHFGEMADPAVQTFDPSEYETKLDAHRAAETKEEHDRVIAYFREQELSELEEFPAPDEGIDLPLGTPAGADETVHNMRTDEGASLSLEMKRGTGTRDQDKWTFKGKGQTAEQAVEELVYELEEVLGDVEDSPLGEQVRQFQPGDAE